MQDFFTDIGIPLAWYTSIFIVPALILLFALINVGRNMAADASTTIKGLAGVLLFVLFVLFCYFTASGDIPEAFNKAKFDHVKDSWKTVHAFLKGGLLILGVSSVLFIGSLVMDVVRGITSR